MCNPYNEIQPYFQSMVMGQIMVSFVCIVFTEFDMERSRWSIDHKLNIDSDLAESQTLLIDNFKEDLCTLILSNKAVHIYLKLFARIHSSIAEMLAAVQKWASQNC